MIHTLALLYVKFFIPALQILSGLILLLLIIYLFNMLRGGDRKNDFIANVVNGMVKGFIKFIQLIGKMIIGSVKLLLKTISLIIATVSDFLTSKI